MTATPISTDALGKHVKAVGLDVGFIAQGWHPDPGGVETHTAATARALIARGHRVHVLALDGREGREPYSTSIEHVDGVEVRRMAYRYHDQRALADVIRNRRAEDVVLAWMAETPCDVIHVHHLTGFGAGALRAIAEVGNPLVMSLHDYWMLCPRGQMFRHDGVVCATPEPAACGECIAKTWAHLGAAGGAKLVGPDDEVLADDAAAAGARTSFALAMLEAPARLFVPSRAAQEVFVASGVARARLELLEYGIDADELRHAVAAERAKLAHREGELTIGVLGALFASKGVLELARAFTQADAPNLRLAFYGPAWTYHGDASTLEALQELVRGDSRIRLCGAYEHRELPGVLARLDGVAAPSVWHETFGLGVREARAAGLPVLVSDMGALADAAQGGQGGLVVRAGDVFAWRDALERFARDRAARERWAAARPTTRTVAALAVDLERAYVETIVAKTGRMPRLAQPIDGLAPATSASASTPREPRGFWRKLFGG
ncbi:MAG: glycosyltransferase [Planctomycetes bacterium]|nr:glycosyltransferase [Planctomycetota bacterium]